MCPYTSPTLTWTGQDVQQIKATVNPDLNNNDIYKPYNREIIWYSGNSALKVVNGVVTPVLDSDWIKEVISKYPYTGTIDIPVTVKTVDNGKTAICMVTVMVTVVDNTYTRGSSGSGGGGGGGGSSKGTTASGTKTASNVPSGAVTGEWIQTADGKWTFVSGGEVLQMSGLMFTIHMLPTASQKQTGFGFLRQAT